MGATVTSFYFLCFLLTVIIVYYIVPQKLQWCVLLLASIAYYLLSGNGILILYPVLTCLTAWLCTRQIGKAQEQSVKRIWMIAAVCLLIGTLVVLKYVNFGINTINGMAYLFGGGQVVSGFHFLIPLGISFYTFSVLGYVIDVYNGIAVPQKSLWKLMTYGMYFPAILSGPIMKYREDAEQFFTPHPFDYKQVTFGMQRMLWGFFKTLVISERMNLIVNTVYGDYYTYQGAYIWLATVCYAFQLYTNFSGCMDIVLGISEIFGIRLSENFETPFFSKTISEYWRRWHITLGVWMKEYVFYPLLRTGAFTKLGKTLRAKFGKKKGKQLTTFTAMLILWFTVGIWHGGAWKFVIGSGLLHWLYIVTGELITPWGEKFFRRTGIPGDSKWINAFRVVRTFFLVNIGFVFFRADSMKSALQMLGYSVRVFNLKDLFSAAIFELGLDWIEFVIAVVSLLILLAVSILQNRGIRVREAIARRKLPVRWLIFYALLFYTILLGYYGPGYSAAEFIYQGF